ncbi:MAG: EVE domain-containing protein [Magnetospirillum sp. WYHS-4]
MAFWLVKSEPAAWSWDRHAAKGVEPWTGVRNHQAAGFLKAMRRGDLAFFYHSVEGKAVVGIVRVVREAYPDPTDPTGRFVCVDMEAVQALPRPVSLAEIKADPLLADLPLVRQARLSVMPIPDEAWDRIRALGGLGR